MRAPGRARALGAFVGALVAMLAASPAVAHQEPYSHLEIRLEPGGLSGTLTAHMVDLAHEAGMATPESLLDRRVLIERRVALESVLATHLDLTADGRRVRPVFGLGEPVPGRRSVRFEWRAPLARMPGVVELHGPLFPYDPPHETFVNVFQGGAVRQQALLDQSHRSLVAYAGSPQGIWAVVRTFVQAGIHHIFIGPDHILFVIGLLLLGGSAFRPLKIVTAFTAAHTVTLVLSALGIVTLPSRIVEPAIAVSIIYVGIDAMRSLDGRRDRRALIAFGFGFVHGFGFASVLREFGLPPTALGASLASFNVGVEIGQACIVLAAMPLLAAARRLPPVAARRLILSGAFGIVVAGAWWLVQRTLLSPA